MSLASQSAPAESLLKTLVAWASVAYAFGFVIVMLHTFRIGVPVLELLKPLYVWVGAPLAGVALIGRRLLVHLRHRFRALTEEAREVLLASADQETEAEKDALQRILNAALALTILAQVGSPLVARLVEFALSRWRGSAVSRSVLAKLSQLVAGLSVLLRAVNLVAYTVAIILLLAWYVWVGYPALPQPLGGGQPSVVRLLVEPSLASVFPGAAPIAGDGASASNPVMSESLSLLYRTASEIFVRTGDERVLSIPSDKVLAIEW